MTTRPALLLDRVLHLLRPLVRLLVRNGVGYPAFAAALKRVFLEAARKELTDRGMPQTDSALSLLSGVHRRDVRQLGRHAGTADPSDTAPAPMSLAAEVVARWMNDARYLQPDGSPRHLPRSGSEDSFDDLVSSVSNDVRPRAVLDELLRLGVVQESGAEIRLEGSGFAPRQGFDEMSWLFAANLHDHAAAAAANLHGDGNHLEQAVYVDQISAESAAQLHQVSVTAWQQAFRRVMQQAQERFDGDAALAPDQRRHRARFGVYFFSEPEE